ncbi:MAG: hypothetical protein FWF96_01505, partial [Kiritimatiellaeota bacterium]|nr:hypothetical protein [Kiritimatiellota bacterium]
FNSKLFVTKDVTAEGFMDAVDLDYDSLEKELEYVSTELAGIFNDAQCAFKDMMAIYYSEDQTGIIPYLEIIDLPGSNGGKKTFKPGGAGIICGGRLAGYLDYTELRSYIFLTKNVKNSTVDIIDNNAVDAFDVVSSKCGYEFIFDEEDKTELKKIKISFPRAFIVNETIQIIK